MRYWVLLFLCLAAVIAYVQRTALSVPANAVKADLGLNSAEMGLILSAWYAGYAAMQLPSGWLADRWGSRLSLTVFACAWSAATGLAALAGDFASLVACWLLMGMAQAGAFPAATKAIGAWFAETERAFPSGSLASSMALGAAIAPALTARLLEWLAERPTVLPAFRDWQLTLLAYATPGVLWALLFRGLVPESPAGKPRHAARAVGRVDWLRLAGSPPMLLLCGQQFLRAAAMVFFYTWFPTFLQRTRGVSQSEAGYLTSWAGLGAMLGGLLGGLTSDYVLRRTGNRWLSRQGLATVGMTSCALHILAAYFVEDTEQAMLLISLGTFCGTFGGVSAYTIAIELGGRHVATVFSTMNMCGNVGAMLFPVTVGYLVDVTGNWDLVLFVFAGIFAAAAICWAFLNPRGPLLEESLHDPC